MLGCGPVEAHELRRRLRTDLGAVGVSASCGVAHLLAGEPEGDLHQLIDTADRDMYEEKHGRRAAGLIPGPRPVPLAQPG